MVERDVLFFPGYDKTVLVNNLGNFFVQKISRIRSELDIEIIPATVDHDIEPPGNVPFFDVFELLSEDDVRKLIMNSTKKSCCLDPILLLECLDAILPVITKMINISLESGCFPNDWKEAIILSLLKKARLVSAFENLRPISNLAYVSIWSVQFTLKCMNICSS